MTERLLDVRPEALVELTAAELLKSIRAAEGRTILAEVVCPVMPLLYDVTNAELVAALGADIILLNLYDAANPAIFGVTPREGESVIRALKYLTGRAIGVNLEPVDPDIPVLGSRVTLEPGRIATPQNARLAYEQGARLIVLTGNPQTGVSNTQIEKAIRRIRRELGDKIILAAGKMHGAGINGEMGENIITEESITGFIQAGADIILMPAPGTVPGITPDFAKKLGDVVHREGALFMTTIGTSQEGADPQTIRTIALNAKMAGADIHHLGDAGYVGIAVPENIMHYSLVIRGRRHTFRRMAMRR
ncbi:aldolase-type tim barrel [Lucifera butyrica]|uniref:Aldolase-type tim barrel n=1 Tax=Lucifera butyrica TaxID=1351585 RepID=A0A498R2H9_9FIRM|nr:haloacid dehalogenase-like hydrolase [Lucifera butyrica]VBB05369.1 aldolase-type tim barrel [Lucifera butyrica]